MNPFGQVPVLEDGDVYIADSGAILLYLAGKFRDESWFPRDSETLAGIVRWFSVALGADRPDPKQRLARLTRSNDRSMQRQLGRKGARC